MTQLSMFGAAQPSPRVLPDETRRKHGGNKHSEAANERVHDYKACAADRIQKFIAGCAELGATLSEIAATLDHPTKDRKFFPNEISGRFKPLVDTGTIFKSGRVRNGSEVYVARSMWCNGSADNKFAGRRLSTTDIRSEAPKSLKGRRPAK